MDLSADNQYIVTLGADKPQTILLWDWTNEKEEGPICSHQFSYGEVYNVQTWVKFNPDDPYELACNGTERVLFMSWEPGVEKFSYYSPLVEKKNFASPLRFEEDFTKTVFLSGNQSGNKVEQAVTGTTGGDILVWDRCLIIEGIGEQNEKRLIKIVQFNTQQSPFISINTLLTVDDKYLVVGNSDGSIRFYDY